MDDDLINNQYLLHRLDTMIFDYKDTPPLLPRSSPRRGLCVYTLAMTRVERYKLLRQQDDLEQSILGFTEAIYLPLPRYTSFPPVNIVQTFYDLTIAISHRVDESKRPEDVNCCITHLRYLHGQRHKVDNPPTVTSTLVCALGVRVDLELGDMHQDIEEMADLCNELLNSDIATNSLTEPIMAFERALEGARVNGKLSETQIPFEKVIGCLRTAIIRLPDMHDVSIRLADILYLHFGLTAASDGDYKEGMAILDKLINFRGPGDQPSPFRERALMTALLFSNARFHISRKPEDLEQAIYVTRTLLDVTPFDSPSHDIFIAFHSYFQQSRSDGSTVAPKLGLAISKGSESGKPPSFRDLTASLPEVPVDPIPDKIYVEYLRTLYSIDLNLDDVTDIEDRIKYCQQLLVSYPGSQLGLRYAASETLCELLYRAFQCTNEIEYLNRAISAARDHISIPKRPTGESSSFSPLISFLSNRLIFFNHREDLYELMRLFPIVTKNQDAESHRFPLLCKWAVLAHTFGHPSVSTAYDRAISSMQALLTLAPTLDIQHSQLVAMDDFSKTLPLNYASYQIHTGQLRQAIKTLERGRAFLWSEIRGLRTSINQVRLIDPQLANNFTAVNRDLETLALALSPKNNIVDGRDSDAEGLDDTFGRHVIRQRKLLDDREKLISQIQALPGLDAFLKPPSFDALHSAARHGPVIIINHCRFRSDILILSYNYPPSLITTSKDFYAHANKLQDQLLGARKKGLESNEYEDTLRSVLQELYELVGQPVIKRLNELHVPEQSRVWWYPTSVFCSLPLHAMGPISSDGGDPQYFLDLYIPSYISSLSSLIESRKPDSQAIGKPSILLVAQPDENMQEALKEMKAVEAVDTEVTTLFSAKVTPTVVLSRLRDHRFMHIVCHGILEPGKPFEASFKLHRGKRLQLLDIVRSQLPDAEFAFLSACHTAELTEESIADEVLHLAAAMQFCGFQSVVGTMWAMADTDGRDLARHFYRSVFSDDARGQYYERTAEALREAVKYLRRKGGMTLERWVNFVHYGA